MSEDVLVPRAVLPPKLTPAVSELPEVIGAIFKELQSLPSARAGRGLFSTITAMLSAVSKAP